MSCLSVCPGICRACKGRKKIPLSQIRSLFFPLSLSFLSPSISFPFLFLFPFFLPPPLSPSEYVMEKGIRIYASHSKAGGRESAYIYPLTIRNNSRFRIHVLSHSCLFYGSKKERERRDAQDIMIKMLELTRLSLFVRPIGLEPTRRKTPDPKSGASTNFATSAWPIAYGDINAVEAKGGCKVTYFYLNTQIFLCFSLFLRLPYSFWNYSSYPISKIHSPI